MDYMKISVALKVRQRKIFDSSCLNPNNWRKICKTIKRTKKNNKAWLHPNIYLVTFIDTWIEHKKTGRISVKIHCDRAVKVFILHLTANSRQISIWFQATAHNKQRSLFYSANRRSSKISISLHLILASSNKVILYQGSLSTKNGKNLPSSCFSWRRLRFTTQVYFRD